MSIHSVTWGDVVGQNYRYLDNRYQIIDAPLCPRGRSCVLDGRKWWLSCSPGVKPEPVMVIFHDFNQSIDGKEAETEGKRSRWRLAISESFWWRPLKCSRQLLTSLTSSERPFNEIKRSAILLR